jgi:formylglycine-generating enzyme
MMRSRSSILVLAASFAMAITSNAVRADDVPMVPLEPLKPIETVLVKGGCYKMGDVFGHGAEDERPVHEVCVRDFYIGRYPVTQMQWTGTMGTNPSAHPKCGLNCPVENVSWNDIQEFLRKLNQRTRKGYRLPTEAEWEFAARSRGNNEEWAGTSSVDELGNYAWFYKNSNFQTHPVGEKKPNGLDLYDMTGNVWQWTSDWYGDGYYEKSPKEDPNGAADGRTRVLRGGYWGDLSQFVRIARRINLDPSARGPGFGFRIVMPAP